jgi:response regulator RpfG family c-di-GMP phosphodiesterase
MTKAKVLFVDDEPHILAGYERNLRRQFDVETALGGEPGLEAVEKRGPFEVIVSDMRMPRMDGIRFLAAAKELAPDSVRMMLTGHADLEDAIKVVNQGNIFRFLTKPCPSEIIAKALDDGVRQYRLIIAERELLEKTLSGSIRVLTEILALVDPRAFDRAVALRDLIHSLAQILNVKEPWELGVAAMLSQIGKVTIPASVLNKARLHQPLSSVEQDILMRMPETGYKLLAHIPRLESVAKIVYYQNKCFNGQGFPSDDLFGEALPLGGMALT